MGEQILFGNNSYSTLTAGLTNVATTCTVANGAKFPSPGAGQYFVATLIDATDNGRNEIVWVTNVTGNTLTIVRAQEGTTAQAWSAGDAVVNMITAGALGVFLQTYQAQAQSYNYAADTGAANAYVAALTPAVTALSSGFPVRLKIANANTGTSTLDAGTGAQPIIYASNLQPLIGGDLVAGAVYTFVWDGANWQIQTPTEIQTITNANGTCRLYPDGWKDQFGTASGIAPDSSTLVTFPVAFATNPPWGAAQVSVHQTTPAVATDDNVALFSGTVGSADYNNTQMRVWNNKINGGSTVDVTYRISWK